MPSRRCKLFAPANEVSFSATVIASGNAMTCSTPSGPMALPSWVTMNRAALPSGDIISCHTGLDVFVVESFSGHVEEVIAAGLVEVVAHVDLVVEGLVGLGGLQMRRAVGVDDDSLQCLRLVAQ